MYKFLLIIFFCSCTISITAQIKPPVARTSSPIFEQLNKEDLEQAEIWLVNEGYSPMDDLEITKTPRQEVHVMKGLAMEPLKDCTLRLEDRSALISYLSLSDDNPVGYQNVHEFFYTLYRDRLGAYLEFNVPLYDLSYKKGKRPRLLSNNPKRPGYNKWAVQIKAKGGLPVLFMATYERRTEKIYGEILTFVFDDEAKARQFDADLRNAIRVCKDFEPEKETEIDLPPGVIMN